MKKIYTFEMITSLKLMGIVKKQSLRNSIISYIGIGIGYVNLAILYPRYFSTSEIGLFQLLVGASLLFSQISALGILSIIPRYFPFYKTEDKKHHGFISWSFFIIIIGFILFTCLFVYFKSNFVNYYIEKSPLFIEYYFYLIPLTFFTLIFNFVEALSRITYRTVFSAFLREIFIRIYTSIGILLFFLHVIDFQQFIIYYIIGNGLISFLLFLQVYLSKQFSWNFEWISNLISKEKKREILTYGFYTFLAGTIFILLQKVDLFILGSLAGLSVVGVYATFVNVATLVSVPAKALTRVSYQIIADSWKSNDLEHIKNIYYKTSILQLIFGCFLFLIILLNENVLFYFIDNPEFKNNFTIFIFAGLSLIIDITGGLNGTIIVTSKKYRYDAVFNFISVIISIGFNFLLIPIFGGLGAAYTACISMLIYNWMKWYFIKKNFGLQPFNFNYIKIILIACISFFSIYFINFKIDFFLITFLKTFLFIILYFLLIIKFNVSVDVNEQYNIFIKKLRKV